MVHLEFCTSNSLCGTCNYIRSLHSATVLFRTPEVVVSIAFNFQQLDTKDNWFVLSVVTVMFCSVWLLMYSI